MRLENIRSVMVVDDDPQIVEQLTGILKDEGFSVKSASNCFDALHIISDDDTPDLFLIDMVMPTVTGDRLCKILSSNPQMADSFRVVLSNMADGRKIDLEAVGAHACVSKASCKSMSANLFRVMRQLDGLGGLDHDDQRTETQVQVLRERLQHAQKMEAVGTLASGFAHDFNNILQSILGYAQLSLTEDHIPPGVINNLKEIQASARNATTLIRRMLMFCRKVDSHRQPVDLNQQIRHVAHMLERTIPRMIRIEQDLDADLKRIDADEGLIEQVLMNLGVNARDAMPDGGRLRFQTRNCRLDSEFCDWHPGLQPGQHVQLTVSDTGIGMTDHVLAHLYDPFFTTKKNGQGTGLGLAMVYGIVKDHAGFITCDSELGQGTVFSLYFPAMDLNTEAKVIHKEEMEHFNGGSEMILLVDDEKGIRDFGQRLLEKFGYTVMTAASAEAALEIYSRNASRIDLVILDLNMPGMGGLKCIDHLREIRPDCRIIISSGYTGNDEVKLAMDAGAQDFVAKPYSIKDLLPRIQEVINLP